MSRGEVPRDPALVARYGWDIPVVAVDGAVVAAISVSGPTARINDRGITALGDLLVAETRGLSAQLGHHSGKEGIHS